MKILPPVSIEARRLLPSRWDLLAAVLVLGFLVAFADASRFLVHPLSLHHRQGPAPRTRPTCPAMPCAPACGC